MPSIRAIVVGAVLAATLVVAAAPAAAAPRVTVTPTSGTAGDRVVIRGFDFGTTEFCTPRARLKVLGVVIAPRGRRRSRHLPRPLGDPRGDRHGRAAHQRLPALRERQGRQPGAGARHRLGLRAVGRIAGGRAARTAAPATMPTAFDRGERCRKPATSSDGADDHPARAPRPGRRGRSSSCSRCCAPACSRSGRWCGSFEEAFAAVVGTRHAVGVSSGTAGLHLGVRLAGAGPGDEVDHEPVLVRGVGQLRALRGRRAGVRRHRPGRPSTSIPPRSRRRSRRARRPSCRCTSSACPAASRRSTRSRRGTASPVVEDAAQALGARRRGRMVGTHGNPAVFAFYPNKQMTTGEGGMVTTDDDDVAARAAQPRQPGPRRRRQLAGARPPGLELPPRRRLGGHRSRAGRAPRRDPRLARRGRRPLRGAAGRACAGVTRAGGGRGRHALAGSSTPCW